MTPFEIHCRGFTRIDADQRNNIRGNPRGSAEKKLNCPSGKRQQGDVARLLDGRAKAPLMRRANPGQPPRHDFAALGDKLGEQPHVLVIDRLDFFGAELAYFLATEIFAPARTAGAAFASAWARTRWTPFSSLSVA